MKKLIVLIFAALIIAPCMVEKAGAQDVLNGIYVKERDIQRKPIPYPHLREADVMWSKEIQRKIDLREKMNLPLYYPTEPMGNNERMSLIDLLLYGIKNEGLKAYDPNVWSGSEFKTPMTWSEVMDKFDAGVDTTWTIDVETGERVERTVTNEINSFEVKQYIVKEIWYFDRKYSTLQCRIVGFCPIREFFKQAAMATEGIEPGLEEEENQDNATQVKLFWIYFDEVRPLLANHEVFNQFNDAERRTFDDIFFKRKFSSYIVQESNVYDNRNINEYSLGINSLLEAEKIKGWIANTEHDLWEY